MPFGGVHERWDNLIAGWKLDESSDGSAPVPRADVLETYELTDNNTTASATGFIGNAASLVKLDSTYLSNAAGPSAQGLGEFLIAAWIKPSSGVHYYHHGNYGAKNIFIITSNTDARFYYYGATGNCIARAPATLTYGTWNLVIGWYDSATGLAYVQVNDGTIFDSGATTTTPIVTALTIFRIGESSANTAEGLVDEFYVFSSKKDAAWRTDMYNAGAGRSYPD